MGIAAVALPIFAAQPNLPKVEILGKEYFYHEIKKGESIYGIAKQHGWDLNELIKLNPNASSEMKKGSRLYYPVDAPVSGNNTNSGNSDRNVNNVVSDDNDIMTILSEMTAMTLPTLPNRPLTNPSATS